MDRTSSAAARAWFASIEWQESERNYLADHAISDELREAFEDALISAFVAGAKWRDEQISAAAP